MKKVFAIALVGTVMFLSGVAAFRQHDKPPKTLLKPAVKDQHVTFLKTIISPALYEARVAVTLPEQVIEKAEANVTEPATSPLSQSPFIKPPVRHLPDKCFITSFAAQKYKRSFSSAVTWRNNNKTIPFNRRPASIILS